MPLSKPVAKNAPRQDASAPVNSLAAPPRCDLLALPDLVQAKKTQRDKDWPMIRRLVEAHYFQNNTKPNSAQIRFWLQELRTPQLLVITPQLVSQFAISQQSAVRLVRSPPSKALQV